MASRRTTARYPDELVALQLADGQAYVKTPHQMNLHNPARIIVPDTFLSASDAVSKSLPPTSILVKYTEEEFPGVPIEPVIGMIKLVRVRPLCCN